jgi:poly-gamma-glutamate synthesis protein (capsule biosynthesis protein)
MNNKDITLLITGDLCPINRIEQLAINKNFEAVFNDFTDVFQGNDLNITDLECPLTESTSAKKKIGPHQKAHPDCIGILKYAGIDLAAMANNHIMDYDYHGAIDTIELNNANNINIVGIGRNIKDAAEPFSVSIKNKRLAIFNFADNEFLMASDGSLMCNQLDPVQIFHDITAAREQHDYIIAIVHAGNEFYELPSPRTKKLYRYLIDVGADAVVAHHTHKFSGYEIYKSKPIFYSLGNFIYDWPGNTNTGWDTGYVVRLLLSDKIGFEIIPLKQGDKSPGVFHLNAGEMQVFQNEIARLNSIICDDNQLEAEFRKYCKSVFPMYDAFIEPNFGKYIAAARKRHLFPKFITKRKRLFLLNLARCESHRDVLIRMLTNFNSSVY